MPQKSGGEVDHIQLDTSQKAEFELGQEGWLAQIRDSDEGKAFQRSLPIHAWSLYCRCLCNEEVLVDRGPPQDRGGPQEVFLF